MKLERRVPLLQVMETFENVSRKVSRILACSVEIHLNKAIQSSIWFRLRAPLNFLERSLRFEETQKSRAIARLFCAQRS